MSSEYSPMPQSRTSYRSPAICVINWRSLSGPSHAVQGAQRVPGNRPLSGGVAVVVNGQDHAVAEVASDQCAVDRNRQRVLGDQPSPRRALAFARVRQEAAIFGLFERLQGLLVAGLVLQVGRNISETLRGRGTVHEGGDQHRQHATRPSLRTELKR